MILTSVNALKLVSNVSVEETYVTLSRTEVVISICLEGGNL